MHAIQSYFILYLKIMVTDKIPFLWTIGLPLVLALAYGTQNDFTYADFLSFIPLFWGYIILSTYLNGIGLQLARMRERGLMKTYIMISGDKLSCILAMILVQVVFAAVSLVFFTVTVSLVTGFFSFQLIGLSLLVLLGSLPLAFASTLLTLVPFKISSMATLANIVMYPLFLVSTRQSEQWFSYLNPFYTIRQLSFEILHFFKDLDASVNGLTLLLALILYLLSGLFAIKRFNLLSILTR